MTEKAQKPMIHWVSYTKQQETQWRYGGILYVSGQNCPPCRTVRTEVFTDPKVIAALDSHHLIDVVTSKWRYYLPNQGKSVNGVPYRGPIKGVPFLIFISPGGNVSYRAQCPTDPQEFLNLVKREGRKIKRWPSPL